MVNCPLALKTSLNLADDLTNRTSGVVLASMHTILITNELAL